MATTTTASSPTLAADRPCDVGDLFERLAIADIQAAADLLRAGLRPPRERPDGFVSLEVSPYLALRHRRTPSPRRGGCGTRSTGRT